MRYTLKDKKNWLAYAFWSRVNTITVHQHFRKLIITGRENIPRSGPFMLVSNHRSRWDGLVVYHAIGRPSNFMVHPNELKGFQGDVLRSMGAFPSDPRNDMGTYVLNQFRKGEGVVIFPEGNIFRHDATQQFKMGAARLALHCSEQGLPVPILPAAIQYDESGLVAQFAIGEPFSPAPYAAAFDDREAARVLTQRMHREVCHLRLSLGAEPESRTLFATKTSVLAV